MDTSTGPASSPFSFRTPPTRQQRCQRKFLRFFPGGFRDEQYLAWGRSSTWAAHQQWQELLGANTLRALLKDEDHAEVARRALRVVAGSNLLRSFELLALRDALRSDAGARAFARGLHVFLHGSGSDEQRFERWCSTLASLSRTPSRILSWPVVTVFGFIAQPDRHLFLKPGVTKRAAAEYGFDVQLDPQPCYPTYGGLLELASAMKKDLRELRPRDMIDIQSFLWVQGSDEY